VFSCDLTRELAKIFSKHLLFQFILSVFAAPAESERALFRASRKGGGEMEPDKVTAAVSLHRATKCFTTPVGEVYSAVHSIMLEMQEGNFIDILGHIGYG